MEKPNVLSVLSTLPPHFTYIVEGCLLFSECSAASTPWLQPQLSSLAMPWGSSDTFSLGRGISGRAVLVIQGGVVLWEGSAELWWHMGCLCALYYPQPAQCSHWCPRQPVLIVLQARFLWELSSKGDACRQCSLLSSIAR